MSDHNRLTITNDYSIISKYSAVKSYYFKDEILLELVEKFLALPNRSRAPIVKLGYAARLHAIDWQIKRSIETEKLDCIISLGAGFDTTPFRIKRDGVCWIEIDLPDVVKVKSKFVCDKYHLGDTNLSEIGLGVYNFDAINYNLIECDLRDSDLLREKIATVLKKVGPKKNVAILNEVCLCYIDTYTVEQILECLISSLRDTAFRIYYIGFEQVKITKTCMFPMIMSRHFEELKFPLKHFPDTSFLRDMFQKSLEFDHLTITSMHNIYHNILNVEIKKGQRIKGYDFVSGSTNDPFDEYEALDLYLSHYSLVTGVKIIKDPFASIQVSPSDKSRPAEIEDSMMNLRLSGGSKSSKYKPYLKPRDYAIKFGIPQLDISLQRYAHASTLVNDDKDSANILITGGFKNVGKGRPTSLTSDICLLSIDHAGNQTIACVKNVDNIDLNRSHGQVCTIRSSNKEDLLFFLGGRKNPDKMNESLAPYLCKLFKDDDGCQILKEQTKMEKFSGSARGFRYRHRIAQINNDEVIQIGGLINSTQSSQGFCRYHRWNLSGDKAGIVKSSSMITNGPFGTDYLVTEEEELYERHSFALAVKQPKCFVVFGGLSTGRRSTTNWDKPVESSINLFVNDDRSPFPLRYIHLENKWPIYYGSDIHFIDDFRFVNIGGINAKTGLACNSVDIFDLRNTEEYVSVPLDILPEDILLLTNHTSHLLECRNEILTLGGGGVYFTFGQHFNRQSLSVSGNW